MPEASQAHPPAPPRRRRWWLEIAIFLAIFLPIRAYQQHDMASGLAPDFTAVSVPDGGHTALEAYRGQAVLVHFWATWCGVCKASQHNITAIADDLPVITVATQSGGQADVSSYLAGHPMGAPVVIDERGALAARYGVRAFPTTFILDGHGEIRHVEIGYSSELGLRARMWLASF